MAIGSAKVATMAEGGSASTSLQGNTPGSLADGDLVLCVWSTTDAPANSSISGGWTAISITGFTSGKIAFNTETLGAFYRVLGAGEASSFTAPTVTSVGAGRISVSLIAYSGVDNATPFDVTGQSNTAGSVSVTVSSVTTVTNNALVFGAAAMDAATSANITKPTEMTSLSASTGTGRRMVVAADTSLIATGGTGSGSRTWTETGTTNLAIAAFHVVLRPAAVVAGMVGQYVRTRSQRVLPKRRAAAVVPVRAQLNPPIQPEVLRPKRLDVATLRRGHAPNPVPPQVNPPKLPDVRRPKPRGWLRRAGHAPTPVPAQQVAAPTWVPVVVRRRVVEALARRGRGDITPPADQQQPPTRQRPPTRVRALVRRSQVEGPTSPQVNPPRLPDVVRPRPRGWLRRPPIVETPTATQQALPTNPDIRTQDVRARLRAALARRATARTPVPAQVNPPRLPDVVRPKPRGVRLRRGVVESPTLTQQAAPVNPDLRTQDVRHRLWLAARSRWQRVDQAPPVQPDAPQAQPRVELHRPERSRTRGAQPPAAQPDVPQTQARVELHRPERVRPRGAQPPVPQATVAPARAPQPIRHRLVEALARRAQALRPPWIGAPRPILPGRMGRGVAPATRLGEQPGSGPHLSTSPRPPRMTGDESTRPHIHQEPGHPGMGQD